MCGIPESSASERMLVSRWPKLSALSRLLSVSLLWKICIVNGPSAGAAPHSPEKSWLPRPVQSSRSNTSHSESSDVVPAEAFQSPPFPEVTSGLRIKACSLVPFDVPATSQPLPGSPSQFPIISMMV